MQLASDMRANLWTRDGEPTEGARVQLPFQFNSDLPNAGDGQPPPKG